MLRNFVAGAPFFGSASRDAYLQALYQRSKGNAEEVNNSLTQSLNRMTDKSIGLLQADALFAVLAIFVFPYRIVSIWSQLIPIIVILAASVLLSFNLRATWPRDPEVTRDADKEVLWTLNICAWRALRLTAALWLTVISVVWIMGVIVFGDQIVAAFLGLEPTAVSPYFPR